MDLKSLKKTFDTNKTKVFQMINQPEFSNIEDLIESCLKSIEESKSSKYDYESLHEIVTLYSFKLRISQEKNPLNYFKLIEPFLLVQSRTREESLQSKFSDLLRFNLVRIHFLLSQIWKKVIIITQKQIKVFSSVTFFNSVYRTDDLIENLEKFQGFSLNLTSFGSKIQEIIENLHRVQVEVEQNSEFISITLTDKEVDGQIQENLEVFIKWLKFEHIQKISKINNLKFSFKKLLKELNNGQSLAEDLLFKEKLIKKVKNSVDSDWFSEFCLSVKSDQMMFDKTDVVHLESYFSEICSKFGLKINDKMFEMLEKIRVPQNLIKLFDIAFRLIFTEINGKNLREKCVKVIDLIHSYLITTKIKVLSKLEIYTFSLYANSCLFIHFNLVCLKYFLKKCTDSNLTLLMFYKLNNVSKQFISEIFSVVCQEFKSKIESELSGSYYSEDLKKHKLMLILKDFRNSFEIIEEFMHPEYSKFYIKKLLDLLILTTEEIVEKLGLDSQKISSKVKKFFSKYF